MSEDKTNEQESAEDVFHWPPLESDPEIMTKYMHSVGMGESWQISEIFGLEPDLLAFVPKPAVACVAAIQRDKTKSDGKAGDYAISNSFYMKQTGTLDNACGVIALIHSALNNDEIVAIEKDSILDKFRAQTAGQTPQQRAKTLEGFNEFKMRHKAFAMQGQSQLAASQKDVRHHFVSFVVNADNELIELDGTKEGPALIQKGVPKDGLLEATAQELMRRLKEGLIADSMSLVALTMKSE